MRTLIWSNSFVRAFKRTLKKHPHTQADLEATLAQLAEDPFTPQLETHKLKGNLAGTWACSAGYDLRIVFEFVKCANQTEDEIFLLGIGTHDEVY